MGGHGAAPGLAPRLFQLQPRCIKHAMAGVSVGSTFGDHRIEDVIGRGGMGVVYRAHQERLSRTVALKVIAPEFSHDADFRSRFERESRTTASIDNPHVIPLFEAGEEDGLLYISMRYVRGPDLGQLIVSEGRLDPRQAIRILDQLADALDTAHSEGLVHRDIKPGNILIEQRPRGEHTYLTDFGLTKHTGSQSGLTKTGMMVGTLDYMAPEQFEGRRLDARADIYALGCVLYEMLTGQVPYPRDSEPAKMYAHMNLDPPAVGASAADLPAEIDEVLQRAMAKKPDDRYLSVGDLAEAARSAIEGRGLERTERSVGTGAAAVPGTAPAAPDEVRADPGQQGAPAEIQAQPAGAQAAAPAPPTHPPTGGASPPAPPPETHIGEAAGRPPTIATPPPPLAPPPPGFPPPGAPPPGPPAYGPPPREPSQGPPYASAPPSSSTNSKRLPLILAGAGALALVVIVAALALTGVIGGGGEPDAADTGGGEAGVESTLRGYARSPDTCKFFTDAFVTRVGGERPCNKTYGGVSLGESDYAIEDIQVSGESATSRVRYTATGKRDRFQLDLVGGEWKISSLNGA